MTLSDGFLLLIRWVHSVAAVTWVGGSLLYVLVLRPVLQAHPGSAPLAQAFAAQFQSVVDICILALLVTGSIMLVDRLTPGDLGVAYIIVVALKIAAALWMFWMAHGLRRRLRRRQPVDAEAVAPPSTRAIPGSFAQLRRVFSGAGGVALVGLGVLLLADVLRWLVEQGLSS